MTTLEGVGYNRRTTPYKQFALDGTLGHVLGACVSVAKKRGVPCFVGDMTAGPGVDPVGQDGSPLILAKHINALVNRGHQITLVCVDKKKVHLDRLRALMGERYPDLTVEYFPDQAGALARIPMSLLW